MTQKSSGSPAARASGGRGPAPLTPSVSPQTTKFTQTIPPLDNKDIEQELFETFFEAKHITSKNETFDAEFYQEVSDLYDQIKAVNYQQGPETYDCSNILL